MAGRYEARPAAEVEAVEVAIDAGDWELRGTLGVPAGPMTTGWSASRARRSSGRGRASPADPAAARAAGCW